MGRRSSKSYGHYITRIGVDDFSLYWTCDRYVKGSRLRFPTTTRRAADTAGAERFAKKWNVKIPGLKCPRHPKYQAKRAPQADCVRCLHMWQESQLKAMYDDAVNQIATMRTLAIPHSQPNPVRR